MDNTASCMIEVCDLHKHYKDVHVLRGISTTVAKGEVCAVIGPSGSGKSNLAMLNFFLESGAGTECTALDPKGDFAQIVEGGFVAGLDRDHAVTTGCLLP